MAAVIKTDKRSIFLICLLIFAFAFGVRLPGIRWGLKNELHNQSYHPDEPLIFDFIHRSYVFRPQSQQEYYNYGTLYYAVLRTSEAIGVATGDMHPPASYDLKDVKSPQQWDELNTYVSQFDYYGRLAGALLGALTCVVVFLIMRRWTTVLGALAGATLISLSPAHVEHSRFQTVDITALFFLSLATLAAVRLLREELVDEKRWWIDVILAAALAGCAASTRYSNGLIALGVMAAIAIRRPKNWPGMIVAVPPIALLAFALTTPGVITDWNYFITNFQYQASHANTGHGLVFVGRPSGFFYHLYELMMGISVPAVVLGLAGLVYAAIRKHKWAWVVLAFFIPYYISIGMLQVMFLRYDFPLYIGMACGFAYAISALQRRMNNQWIALGVAVLALSGIENPQAGVRGTLLFTKWMTSPDPRDVAGYAVKDLCNKTPNLDIGVPGTSPWFWSAAVIKDAEFVYFHPEVQRGYLAQTQNPHVVGFASGQVPMYATYSSYESEDAERLKDRIDLEPDALAEVQTNVNLVRAINRTYIPVATFGDERPGIHDLEYIQPKIYLLEKSPALR